MPKGNDHSQSHQSSRRSKVSGESPLFSIIVPAYNVDEYISRCIESVLEQDESDFELIIVDDGSTDQTGKICDQYTKNLPHNSIISQNDRKVNRKPVKFTIKVIHQPNAGLSAARNTGVREACGEYLIFLDGDDYLEATALKAIKAGLEPELDLLRYQAQEIFSSGKTIGHEEAGFNTISGVEAFAKLAHSHYTENAWLYAYRRRFFIENNFQYAEGRLSEDFGLTPLIITCAKKVKAIPDICYNYRQRAGSIMHDAARTAQRMTDIAQQLQVILPKIAQIPGAQLILHYLVTSFLTGAAELNHSEFLQVYREAKRKGMLQYVHPVSVRAIPRALLLKHFPSLFYRLYHR